jgi:hypothetical protein
VIDEKGQRPDRRIRAPRLPQGCERKDAVRREHEREVADAQQGVDDEDGAGGDAKGGQAPQVDREPAAQPRVAPNPAAQPRAALGGRCDRARSVGVAPGDFHGRLRDVS